jgi:hypothetical protein
MSDPFLKLTEIYRKHADIEVVSGLNSYHFQNWRDAPFTHYFKENIWQTGHLGISIWELMLFEKISTIYKPSRIYIVGNGLGWSTLGLALLNPAARVVAIDPDQGIELVNRIAAAEGLNCVVRAGFSPDDNSKVIMEEFDAPPDLFLIDGMHTNDHVAKDWASLYNLGGAEALYMFHDVINFDLLQAMRDIRHQGSAADMTFVNLLASPSGMAALVPTGQTELINFLKIFSPSAGALNHLIQRANALGSTPRQMFHVAAPPKV